MRNYNDYDRQPQSYEEKRQYPQERRPYPDERGPYPEERQPQSYYEERQPQSYYEERRPYPEERQYQGNGGVAKRNIVSQEPVSVGKIFISTLLLAIPVINVICFIYWLFGGGNCKSRTNFIRASLIWIIIGVVIIVIVCVVFGWTLSEFMYYYNSL